MHTYSKLAVALCLSMALVHGSKLANGVPAGGGAYAPSG